MASLACADAQMHWKTWRICLDIEVCQFKNGYSSPTSMGTPPFFQLLQSTYHKLCVRKDSYDFCCWKLKKKEKWRINCGLFYLPFGNHVKKFGSNFNQGFSFMSNPNLKYLFLSDTCIDCSLMHVLKSLGHKNLQLLLGMRTSNKH